MEYRQPGAVGLIASERCLCTRWFDRESDGPTGIDRESARDLLTQFEKAGESFVDTAPGTCVVDLADVIVDDETPSRDSALALGATDVATEFKPGESA